MDGILNFNKPIGWTSHDAVARVRRLIREKRVGHAGTLDPLATGVLLVCIGQATRVAEYLMASDKVYLARIRLGITTDTYDSQGQVTGTREVQVNEPALQAVLAKFSGEIEQVPPMYSALKHQGKPLYKLARQGVEVERAARKVTIYGLFLRELALPEFAVEVHCSSGTYIRSLAHDIGQALGCGAHMTALERRASGAFSISQAVTAAKLEEAIIQENWQMLLHPIDTALQALPAVTLEPAMAQRVRHGQKVNLPMPPASACRAYDGDGKLVALMVYQPEADSWRPDKVFDLA